MSIYIWDTDKQMDKKSHFKIRVFTCCVYDEELFICIIYLKYLWYISIDACLIVSIPDLYTLTYFYIIMYIFNKFQKIVGGVI